MNPTINAIKTTAPPAIRMRRNRRRARTASVLGSSEGTPAAPGEVVVFIYVGYLGCRNGLREACWWNILFRFWRSCGDCLPMQEAEDHRHEQEGSEGRENKTANYGPAERRVLLATVTETKRHR